MIVETLRMATWLLRRRSRWAHARELVAREFRTDRDSADERAKAHAWACERAVPVADALAAIGLSEPSAIVPRFPGELASEGRQLAERATCRMGGPGDLDLIYAAAMLCGARNVVETGVAYGWSSLAVLAALRGRDGARLVSVDRPYVQLHSDPWVGVAVPDRLRTNWEIIREPDRRGLEKAIARLNGRIDLCHYDSDKTYWGRQYAYPLLWDALNPGGVFISDDIQDNMAFAEFVQTRGLDFAVTECEGKYVGITRKEAV
jgi:predicted O-methyltransferase YrrM